MIGRLRWWGAWGRKVKIRIKLNDQIVFSVQLSYQLVGCGLKFCIAWNSLDWDYQVFSARDFEHGFCDFLKTIIHIFPSYSFSSFLRVEKE